MASEPSIHRVRRGLDLPLSGAPSVASPAVDARPRVTRVGLVGVDYLGLRPTLHVAAGDAVRRGQLLFEDKRAAGVRFTSPVEGTVLAIHRGDRRAFQSIVIDVSPAERAGRGDQVPLASFTGRPPRTLGETGVRDLLIESGLWTALRARPFSRVARPDERPRSIFVTAVDTAPLAPDLGPLLVARRADFEQGLEALAQLTAGPVFVCTSERSTLTVPPIARVRHERFAGPHPSGTVGLHMHTLDPAGRGRVVWHAGAQDVLAIGRLFATGQIDAMRTVGLGGPAVRDPRLLRVPLGASVDDLTAGEIGDGSVRVVSGSVLSGRAARGSIHGYLGRYHRQICALPEGGTRELLGWAVPGAAKFSSLRMFVSGLRRPREFPWTTSTNGSARAIIPIGVYERVMPFDVEPAYLLKALVTGDVERAEALGCLELDEEDLALCTFVCPGKIEYGRHLREVLSALEKDG